MQDAAGRIDASDGGRNELAFRFGLPARVRIGEIIGQQTIERGASRPETARVDRDVMLAQLRLSRRRVGHWECRIAEWIARKRSRHMANNSCVLAVVVIVVGYQLPEAPNTGSG